MAELNEKARRLIEEPNFGYIATVMEDGSPHVSPVWVDVENGYVRVNTATGRVKERNLRRDPRVAISVADRNNQYKKVDIRGRVVNMSEGDEAEQHIDVLAKKYMDVDAYPWRSPDERRVIVRIQPERVS
ncbi:MAG: PPOX class F420-dependent oxidoreductase [Actinobacteria bacterium]|nr:PPOX class F420-dependent oxidoreductase [Actinomycetota bacterium]